MKGNAGLCGPLPEDGNGVPEQFWNCAEISITNGPVTPTTIAPVLAPLVTTSPAPSYQYTSALVAPTPASVVPFPSSQLLIHLLRVVPVAAVALETVSAPIQVSVARDGVTVALA
jgi:hypothetical protein